MSSFILAIACVFTGIDLEMLDLPEYTFWIMVGYVLLNAVTYILLKLVIGVAENGVARKQGEHYELQDRTGPIGSRNQLVGDEKVTPPSSRMAIFLLGLHSVGVVGITVALTCITASM
ncbi:uncharacterized protein [Ptychodera flava]|uniref:uncharacterized protein n=1 Tax=Ptychodera flava TaxID=63121 RepID=UPI003969F1D7